MTNFRSGFVICNAMSANSGMAFDLSATTELLGYLPEDDVTQHPRPDVPDADFKMALTVRP